MSSYYDDDELGPVMRERDEEAIDWAIREREREVRPPFGPPPLEAIWLTVVELHDREHPFCREDSMTWPKRHWDEAFRIYWSGGHL